MKAERSDEFRAATRQWAQANGLDPERICDDIYVADGEMIRYRELVGHVDGAPVWEHRSAVMVAPFPPGVYR